MEALRLSWLAIVMAVVVVNLDNVATRHAGVERRDVSGAGRAGKCRDRHKHRPDDGNRKEGGSSGSGGSGGVGGAGEPWYMSDDSQEEQVKLDRDREFREKERSSAKQAPLVCFLRGDGFTHTGAMRFPLNTIPKNKCTHIVYSYLETDNKTGNLLFRKKGLHEEKALLRKLASMKNKRRHLKVLYSYGGGAHWSSLLNRLRSDKDMKKLIKELDMLLREKRLDGINFHLEGPGPSSCSKNDADRVLQFIREFRLTVADHDVLLTMQLPACRDSKCDHVQKKELARYIDYFFLMTFDYKLDDLSRTRITSGVLQYENGRRTHIDTEGCVYHWTQAGVQKNQIIPGIPTYGRSYTLENQNKYGLDESLKKSHPLGYGANFTKVDGYMNYIETCRRVVYFHWPRQWVNFAATPYIHYQDQWISYEDRDSVKYKIEWMRKNKLGGIFLWSLEADDYAGSCQQRIRYPLVEAARKALEGYRPS
ncbi:endochitinase-like [Dermacentor albipictus]|uniref:endochitinase-like n=1 Tax=Dermacentor albipictus TaxID=60249 RepID=UPI0038FCF2C7